MSQPATAPRFVRLEVWAKAEFGDDAPSLRVLQQWAREGRFSPPAELRGRCYFLKPDAQYRPIHQQGRRPRLAERLNVAVPKKRA